MADAPEVSGLDNDYWMIEVRHPKRLPGPYWVETEDLIEALELPFAEATVLKALVRLAHLRLGKGKPNSTESYEAEKMVYYSGRTLAKVLNRVKEIIRER